jgi:hypothetical protein
LQDEHRRAGIDAGPFLTLMEAKARSSDHAFRADRGQPFVDESDRNPQPFGQGLSDAPNLLRPPPLLTREFQGESHNQGGHHVRARDRLEGRQGRAFAPPALEGRKGGRQRSRRVAEGESDPYFPEVDPEDPSLGGDAGDQSPSSTAG